MTDILFLECKELYEDRKKLESIIKEYGELRRIEVKTSNNTCVFSTKTQEKLIKKLKELLTDIEWDFAEL